MVSWLSSEGSLTSFSHSQYASSSLSMYFTRMTLKLVPEIVESRRVEPHRLEVASVRIGRRFQLHKKLQTGRILAVEEVDLQVGAVIVRQLSPRPIFRQAAAKESARQLFELM